MIRSFDFPIQSSTKIQERYVFLKEALDWNQNRN